MTGSTIDGDPYGNLCLGGGYIAVGTVPCKKEFYETETIPERISRQGVGTRY